MLIVETIYQGLDREAYYAMVNKLKEEEQISYDMLGRNFTTAASKEYDWINHMLVTFLEFYADN